MSRKAKGKRPIYFENPESDRLLAITMAVAGELAVLRERLDTVERLAEDRGLLLRSEIESYRADEAVEDEREAWRAEYLERVLRIVHHELESEQQGETRRKYEREVRDHLRQGAAEIGS
ncbi:MAG TPA: hypothetical protein VFA86_06885 [Gammaproteobacteria bacterium]|nr:hypothetical protein [Gammaproteobacteria bacterium]